MNQESVQKTLFCIKKSLERVRFEKLYIIPSYTIFKSHPKSLKDSYILNGDNSTEWDTKMYTWHKSTPCGHIDLLQQSK